MFVVERVEVDVEIEVGGGRFYIDAEGITTLDENMDNEERAERGSSSG